MSHDFDKHPLEDASPLMELFWYDGPVLSLYRATDQSLYFRMAEVLQDNIEQWAWVAASHAMVIAFLREEVDLLTCCEASSGIVMETLSGEDRHWSSMEFTDLSDDLLPDSGCVLVTDGNLEVSELIALLEREAESS